MPFSTVILPLPTATAVGWQQVHNQLVLRVRELVATHAYGLHAD